MRTIKLLLCMMLFANASFAQHQNLNKLPESKRNRILVQIANEAIERFSTGYLRKDAKPIIENTGVVTNENTNIPGHRYYLGRYVYAVYYKGTDAEHNYRWYNKEYLVKAYILADIGKVTAIRYIDDDGRLRYALEETSDDEIIEKRRFITIEEREKEYEKSKPRLITYDKEMDEQMKRKVARQDSIRKEALRRNLERYNEIQEKKRLDSLNNVKKQ